MILNLSLRSPVRVQVLGHWPVFPHVECRLLRLTPGRKYLPAYPEREAGRKYFPTWSPLGRKYFPGRAEKSSDNKTMTIDKPTPHPIRVEPPGPGQDLKDSVSINWLLNDQEIRLFRQGTPFPYLGREPSTGSTLGNSRNRTRSSEFLFYLWETP